MKREVSAFYGRNGHAGHSFAAPGILIHYVRVSSEGLWQIVKFTVFFAEKAHKLFNVVVD